MNRKRNPTYIKLKQSINSCTQERQLDTLTLLVLDYANHNLDGADLLLEFQTKKTSVSLEPYYLRDSIEYSNGFKLATQ